MIICLNWASVRIKIVTQLSKVNVWNKENQKLEQMYNSREEIMNTLIYVDFQKCEMSLSSFLD